MSVPTATPADERTSTQTLALELLAIHRDAMDRERRTRLHLIQAAQHAGLTNHAIGAVLGMGESGVRMFVKRETEAAA